MRAILFWFGVCSLLFAGRALGEHGTKEARAPLSPRVQAQCESLLREVRSRCEKPPARPSEEDEKFLATLVPQSQGCDASPDAAIRALAASIRWEGERRQGKLTGTNENELFREWVRDLRLRFLLRQSYQPDPRLLREGREFAEKLTDLTFREAANGIVDLLEGQRPAVPARVVATLRYLPVYEKKPATVLHALEPWIREVLGKPTHKAIGGAGLWAFHLGVDAEQVVPKLSQALEHSESLPGKVRDDLLRAVALYAGKGDGFSERLLAEVAYGRLPGKKANPPTGMSSYAQQLYSTLGSHYEQKHKEQWRKKALEMGVEDPYGLPEETVLGPEHAERIAQKIQKEGIPWAIRQGAFRLLKRLGPHGKPALPTLVALIDSAPEEHRPVVLLAIGATGADTPEVRRVVQKAQASNSPVERFAAAVVRIRQGGAHKKEGLRVVRELLHGSELPSYHQIVSETLFDLTKEDDLTQRRIIEALIGGVIAPGNHARAQWLALFGAQAAPFVRTLLQSEELGRVELALWTMVHEPAIAKGAASQLRKRLPELVTRGVPGYFIARALVAAENAP